MVVSKAELKFPDSSKVRIRTLPIYSFSVDRSSMLDYLNGKVKIDEYVTHHRKFAEINDGFHDMHVSPKFENSTQTGQMADFL